MLYTFNKYFADYVMYLKKASPELKRALAHYKVMERLSELRENLDHFRVHVADAGALEDLVKFDAARCKAAPEDAEAEVFRHLPVRAADAHFVRGVALRDALRAVCASALAKEEASEPAHENDEAERARRRALVAAQLWSTLGYAYIIGILYLACADADNEDNAYADALLQKVIMGIMSMRATPADKSVNDVLRENDAEIMDPDILALFDGLQRTEMQQRTLDDLLAQKTDGGGGAGEGQFCDAFEALKHTKIGQLAKEMGDEIDPSELNLDENTSPADLLNIQNFMNPASPMHAILTRLGSKMSQKFTSGELRTEELMGEVLGILDGNQALRSNPMVNTMMNAVRGNAGASGGNAAQNEDPLENISAIMRQMNVNPHAAAQTQAAAASASNPTRDRLRRKVNRQQQSAHHHGRR